MGSALQDIAAERQRQTEVEGWDSTHDDHYVDGALALAAASYAFSSAHRRGRRGFASVPDIWPWHKAWWKPAEPRRDLVKAGALIVAEIERLDRLATQPDRKRA